METPSGGSDWTPKLDAVVSYEQRECLKIAYQICAMAERKFPKHFAFMEKPPPFPNKDAGSPLDLLRNFPRHVAERSMESVGGFAYELSVEATAFVTHEKDRAPVAESITHSGINIRIRPESMHDESHNPLTVVIIEINKYSDERTFRAPRIKVGVRSLRVRGPIIPEDLSSQNIYFESRHSFMTTEERASEGIEYLVPLHFLTLDQVAKSEDPELGGYALSGIKEVLQNGFSCLRDMPVRNHL